MFNKKKLLVVDDSSGIRETLSDIFSEIGHDVEVAGTGYEAIERIKKSSYDMVVMDIKMPGDGITTLKTIKEFYPSLKVILITAYCDKENYKKALSHDVHAIMCKPLDLEKLINIIENPEKKLSISL